MRKLFAKRARSPICGDADAQLHPQCGGRAHTHADDLAKRAAPSAPRLLCHRPRQPGGHRFCRTCSTNAGTLAGLSGTTWNVLPTPQPAGARKATSSAACPARRCRASPVSDWPFAAPAGFPPQTLAERWNGVGWRIQPTPLLPGVGDLSYFSVACPAESTGIAAGGFENDGLGAKTLTVQWRATGTAVAQTAPPAFSPRAYRGIAGCIRAAMDEGLATEAAATRIGPKIKATMPQRSQPASGIERITSLCGTA